MIKKKLWDHIAAIDLTPINVKFASNFSKLSRAEIELVELEYRRFLYLSVSRSQPGFLFVPIDLVDEYWHTHILDTEKYWDDCLEAFGYVIHHFPYFGMRGSDDEVALDTAFQRSLRIYHNEYNEHLIDRLRDLRSKLAGYELDFSAAAAVCTGRGCNDSLGQKEQQRPTWPRD